jgi:hypothetical protein
MKDDGGSAFPVAHQILDANHEHFKLGCKGMTLRDYFAAKAMQAILTKLPIVDQDGEFGVIVKDKIAYNNDIANSAYSIADAMLDERNKL